MRMPNSRQISEEQQDVFEDAPIDGNILVTGPPGTGKTVIAFLRAQAIARQKSNVVVLMFNRVLRRYTENVKEKMNGNIKSKTLHSWLPEWWRSHKIEQPTEVSDSKSPNDRTYLISPIHEKDEVKAYGGTWDPDVRKWYVNSHIYDANIELFSKWPVFEYDNGIIYLTATFKDKDRVKALGARWDSQKKKWYITNLQFKSLSDEFAEWLGPDKFAPPEIERWEYNWDMMHDQYLDLEEQAKVDWGYLIIDEAQDFSPTMFKFLRRVGKDLPNGGLTVLADENQRLEESRNSSIDEIRKNLRIKDGYEFKLTKNFRNTRPIAEVARFFYVGLQSGVPDLPDRDGNKPKLITTKDKFGQVNYIKKFLQFRGAQEVGVIVDSDADRNFFVDELKAALPSYLIQTYTSKKPTMSEELVFDSDSQGVITILNRRSCKGLEFDTIFIPQLQNFKIDDMNISTFRMNLYVMCSRARNELFLMKSDCINETSLVLLHLPSEDSGLLEYIEEI